MSAATTDEIRIMLENILEDKLGKALEPIEKALSQLRIQVDAISARAKNAAVARLDALSPVPNKEGNLPPKEMLPTHLTELTISGFELLPDGTRNPWTKARSERLLSFYNESDLTSDTEEENTLTARRRRLKVAEILGVSTLQLANAATSIY